MAREIINRQVNIYIQSGEAQKAYDALIKKEKELNAELSKTTDPKRMKKLRDDLTALQEPISRAAKKVSGELEPSLKDVESTANKLRNTLKRMSESDADYGKVTAQYQQANRELEMQRQKVGFISKAWKSFWQEAKTVAAGVIIGNTIQAALETVLGYVTGIVTGSAKIADELSDIEKTTGLTNEQVRELNRELGKIDTRTSRSELRKLAAEGGKLGFETVPELLKFVDAADKIRVALKEDLGEEAILDIAKASKIFQVEMLNMASAINEIGAASTASESFSVDFIKRTGGVAATVKIAAGDILGYSSALEQAGQTTEVSATALNTFFLDFVSNIDKFGKAAGFAKGELRTILGEQGTNEAFLSFLERLRQAQPTAAGFINALKDLGIDGARGSNVMLTLANNIGEVRKQQEIANNAIQSNGSIMNEFNKKNNNAAAALDKFKKNVAGLFQSESFQRAGENAISLMNSFINVLKSSFTFIKEHGGLVATLGTLYTLLVVRIKGASIAQVAHNLVTKAGALITNTITAAQALYVAVTMRSTASLTLARRAQLAWNAAASLGAGPLGVLLVGVGALVIAVGNLFNRTKDLTAAQKVQAEIAERVNEATASTVAELETLLKVAADENVQLDNRKKAIEALIRINPEFEKTLKINTAGHLEGAEAIKQYIVKLKEKAEAEAKYALLLEKTKEKNNRFNEIRQKIYPGLTDQQIENEVNRLAGMRLNIFSSDEDRVLNATARPLKDLLDQIKILQTDIATTSISAVSKASETTKLIDESVKNVEQSSKKTRNELADLEKDLQKIRDELRLSQLTPLQRELAELDIKFNALRERAGKNYKLLQIIDELYHESKLQLIQEYGRKEVELWGNSQQEVSKKSLEVLKANIKAIKEIQNKLDVNGEDLDRRVNRGRLAGRELDVLKARGREKLKAELELLKEQEKQELQQKDLTENEKLLIEEKYRIKRKQAEIDFRIEVVQTTLFFMQGLADIDNILSDAQTQRENRQLESDRRVNDAKIRNLKRQLDSKLITQLEYDRKVQQIEREQERREKIARKKQFEREKRAQLVAALINNAGAVTTTLQKFGPPIPPNFLGIAAMALTVLTGLTQIATIAGSKAPEFGRGGVLSGRYHSQGGNPILDGSGRKIGEIEKDEGIINRFSMRDKSRYTVTGTPSQIASRINSLNGWGVNWEPGARLEPKFSTLRPAAFNYPNIRRYFATGGKFDAGIGSAAAQQVDMSALDNLAQSLNTLNAILDNGIVAYSIISQQEKAQARLNAIREDATMKG